MWAKRRPALAALLGAVAVLLVSGAGLLATFQAKNARDFALTPMWRLFAKFF
jgi:hypothetical protein